MSKSHGIHKQSSEINAFLFNSIAQKKWNHQTMRRTMTKKTKTAKVNLKMWKYRPSNCLITRWKCVDNLPYIMHYILDDLKANSQYDCDCNSVDLLQFLNMFKISKNFKKFHSTNSMLCYHSEARLVIHSGQ